MKFFLSVERGQGLSADPMGKADSKAPCKARKGQQTECHVYIQGSRKNRSRPVNYLLACPQLNVTHKSIRDIRMLFSLKIANANRASWYRQPYELSCENS